MKRGMLGRRADSSILAHTGTSVPGCEDTVLPSEENEHQPKATATLTNQYPS